MSAKSARPALTWPPARYAAAGGATTAVARSRAAAATVRARPGIFITWLSSAATGSLFRVEPCREGAGLPRAVGHRHPQGVIPRGRRQRLELRHLDQHFGLTHPRTGRVEQLDLARSAGRFADDDEPVGRAARERELEPHLLAGRQHPRPRLA